MVEEGKKTEWIMGEGGKGSELKYSSRSSAGDLDGPCRTGPATIPEASRRERQARRRVPSPGAPALAFGVGPAPAGPRIRLCSSRASVAHNALHVSPIASTSPAPPLSFSAHRASRPREPHARGRQVMCSYCCSHTSAAFLRADGRATQARPPPADGHHPAIAPLASASEMRHSPSATGRKAHGKGKRYEGAPARPRLSRAQHAPRPLARSLARLMEMAHGDPPPCPIQLRPGHSSALFCPARGAPSPGSSPLSLISEPALHAPRLNTRLLLDGPPRIPRHCPIDARGAASMGTARATTQRNGGAIESSQCS